MAHLMPFMLELEIINPFVSVLKLMLACFLEMLTS